MQIQSLKGLVGSLVVAFAALTMTACGGATNGREPSPAPGASTAATPPAPAPSADPDADRRPRVVLLGDSLTAGLGLNSSEAYPARLQEKLDAGGYQYRIVNMGVSGDTSAGGLRRLDWALDGDVRVLVIALGANDGLRGLAPADLATNLTKMIEQARERKIRVLLCGMEAPPNFGASYTTEFRATYRNVARDTGVAFLPFLLDGVAGEARFNQGDGIHPNVEGARRVADLVWPHLKPLLDAPAPS